MGYMRQSVAAMPSYSEVEIKSTDERGRPMVLRGYAHMVSISAGEWGDITIELRMDQLDNAAYTIEYPQIKGLYKHFEEWE